MHGAIENLFSIAQGQSERMLAKAAQLGPQGYKFLLAAAPLMVAFCYFFTFWERRKDGAPDADDTQVGLKLLLYGFLIASLAYAANGLTTVVGFLASGAKPSSLIKTGLGSLVAGGAVFVLVFLLFLPRTNAKDYDRAERWALAFVAAAAGAAAIVALHDLLVGLFSGHAWRAHVTDEAGARKLMKTLGAGKLPNALYLAEFLVFAPLTFLALNRFGGLSGWTMPVRQAPMQPGFGQQMPGQGYGQPGAPQGGYQQPGSAPQQYPQGGYPQQGGYPPGGGYNPQGGGGLPPPSGGGFPPR